MLFSRRWVELIVVAALSLCIIGLQVAHKGVRAPIHDEFVYLSIARDLNTTNTFSDGEMAESTAGAEVEPGRFFVPGYPVFLSLLSRLDQNVADFVACNVRKPNSAQLSCRAVPYSLLAVQSIFAAVGVASIYAAALMLSMNSLVAALTAALVLATGEPAYYARTYLTENTAFLGFYVFMAAAVASALRPRPASFALAGAALAFAALSRQSYLYLIYVCVPLLAVAAWQTSRTHSLLWRGLTWREVGAFAIAASAVLAPWVVRNLFQFGDAALSAGYGGFILVQRIAYNAMTATEWGVSLVYWLPDFGDSLAQSLFATESYMRLEWDNPSGFYSVGNGELMRTTLADSGGRAHHLSYLIKAHLLPDPMKHLFVTLPLTLRGIWVGKYLSLAGALLAFPVARTFYERGGLLPFLAFCTPPVFMTALHGLISVNVLRYNVPMIGPYAFVVAFAVAGILARFGWRSAAPLAPCREYQGT